LNHSPPLAAGAILIACSYMGAASSSAPRSRKMPASSTTIARNAGLFPAFASAWRSSRSARALSPASRHAIARFAAASSYPGRKLTARSNAARASSRRPSERSALPRLLYARALSGSSTTTRPNAATARAASPLSPNRMPSNWCALAKPGSRATACVRFAIAAVRSPARSCCCASA
jgi:hypothetical protein